LALNNRNIVVGGLLAACSLACAAPASAQATRTWVSGDGDDVNPCSRTSPCKTFSGAMSKTAAGGEIDCLDPGGFGTLTITKSITIDCSGTFGSVLNSGGINGFVINDSATATPGATRVILRGLSIDGAGTTPGLNGIRFISGASLVLDNVMIQNSAQPNGYGVSFQPAAAAKLFLNNVVITGNGGGVLVQPTGTGSAQVTLNRVQIAHNTGTGVLVSAVGNTGGPTTSVSIYDSSITGNQAGIASVSPPGTKNVMTSIRSSTVNNNASYGILSNGSGAQSRVAESQINNNDEGVKSAAGGVLVSYGDNKLYGNLTDGSWTVTVPQS
jgi:hypothetical protein